jgi:hypothetical protein
VQLSSHTDWVLGWRGVRKNGEKNAPKFVHSSTYHKEEATIKPTNAHYPSNLKPSFNPKREVRKETSKQERKLLFACFVVVQVIWMSFAFDERELRRCAMSMLETHIMMSYLIYRLVLILVFCLARTLVIRLTLFHVLCLALILVLCLSSLIDLTITHMVLVHERTALCLDALDMAHALTMVIVFRVDLVFLLEGLTLTLSRDI